MNAIETLKSTFSIAGVDADRCLHIGNSKRMGKTVLHSMPRCYINKSKEKDIISRQFAVRYFEFENIFVAWDVKILERDTRTKYTLTKNAIPDNIASQKFTIVNKRQGNRGGKLEPVAVFTPEGIERFLKHYSYIVAHR